MRKLQSDMRQETRDMGKIFREKIQRLLHFVRSDKRDTLSLRGAERRSNLGESCSKNSLAKISGDCFASLAMTKEERFAMTDKVDNLFIGRYIYYVV